MARAASSQDRSSRRQRRTTDRARFIVVSGPPCAGKSTMAGRLSKALDAPHLEMDRFRGRVLPLADQRVEHRDIAYRAMHFTAELMAPWCATLILDATYTAAVSRNDLSDVVEGVDGQLFVVECHVSAGVASTRFLRRRGPHPAVDLTTDRVADLAAGYRYFAGACAVETGADRTGFSRVIEYVQGEPLDRSTCAAWVRIGQPREATNGGAASRSSSSRPPVIHP